MENNRKNNWPSYQWLNIAMNISFLIEGDRANSEKFIDIWHLALPGHERSLKVIQSILKGGYEDWTKLLWV